MDKHDVQDSFRRNALTSSSCASCLSMFESLPGSSTADHSVTSDIFKELRDERLNGLAYFVCNFNALLPNFLIRIKIR